MPNNDTAPLATVEDQLALIHRRLDRGSERMDKMSEELAANTAITEEIRDLMTAARVGFKVLGAFGVFAKWIGMLAGAALAVYTLLYALTHGGATPK